MNPYVDPDGTLHEEYTAEILLRTDADWVELGEVVYDAGARFLSWPRFGFACFCPHCGEVWAQVRAHNSRGVEQRYEPVVVSCERHLDPWEVPGSLLHKFLPELLDRLPDKVLRHEFRVHAAHYEKGVQR